MDLFLMKIAEILEVDVDDIQSSDELKSFDSWDSLSSLSIISFVEEDYKIPLFAKEILEAKTVGGLYELIIKKQDKSV